MHIFLQHPTSGAPEKGVTEKGNERIRSILEEAKNALVDEGFSGLSFRTIAKRAGITVGNVTYYFPTKDHLLVELAGYIFDRWDVKFRRELPKTLTEKMDIFLYSIRYMIEENKRVKSSTLLLEMWAMANRSTSVMRMLDTFYARMRSWIEEMLRHQPNAVCSETSAAGCADHVATRGINDTNRAETDIPQRTNRPRGRGNPADSEIRALSYVRFCGHPAHVVPRFGQRAAALRRLLRQLRPGPGR